MRDTNVDVEESIMNEIASLDERHIKEYIHQVGKAANQRLRQLEKSGLEKASPSYRFIERLSRDKDYATAKTGAGEVKFNLRVRGRTMAELRHMANAIEKFMNAPTSTVTGVKASFEEAEKTFRKNHPDVNIDYKEFGKSFSYGVLANFARIYGSDELVKLQSKTADKMTQEEVIFVLESVGFREDTRPGEGPALSTIYGAIDAFMDARKDLNNDGSGLFEKGEKLE